MDICSVNFRSITCIVLCILFSSLGFSQSKKEIRLVRAGSLEADPSLGPDVKRLVGSVEFEHENAHLFCDSAYLYPNNSMDAFGNVRIKQGDSLNITGNFLKYNGNTRMAELHKNVRFTQRGTTLTTDLLYYDMKTSMATYSTGGVIISKQNTLTSQLGYFNTRSRIYSFKKNVVLTNPQYVMTCDTLNYYSMNNTAYFTGPTYIKSKGSTIYCESGWYNTDNDHASFRKNASIISGSQRMKGDSIYYDKQNDIGKAFGNVSITDSAQSVIVSGDLAVRNGRKETSVVTGKALLKQYYGSDTLFLHADTLRSVDEHPRKNKKEVDTSITYRTFYAYRNVKFYRTDIQGKCDSLVYTGRDSLMRLFKSPVLWSEENQLTAEKVELKTSGGEIMKMFLKNSALIVSKEDSVKYNQIKGKEMTGYFSDNKLYKILVEGNGQTIYFAKDRDKLIGVNKTECSNLIIFVKENKVDKITFLKKPDATLFPMTDFSPKEFLLKGFVWREKERPQELADIFR